MPALKIMYLIIFLNSRQYKDVSCHQELKNSSNVDKNGKWISRGILKYSDSK
jgi:hypothetical protein